MVTINGYNSPEDAYVISIGAKINDLGWPWMADTHSVAEKMGLSEPTTREITSQGHSSHVFWDHWKADDGLHIAV